MDSDQSGRPTLEYCLGCWLDPLPDRHRPKRPVLTSNLDVLPSREILPDAPDAALSFEQQRAQTVRFGIFEAQDPANAATDNQQVKPLTLLHNYPADCTPRRG